MNIKLTLRLQNNVLETEDGNAFVFDKNQSYYSGNFLITPLYALPTDVSDLFMDEPGIYENALYKILFEGSLDIDSILTKNLQTSLGFSDQLAFYLKRRYVICYATFHFGKIFYRDYLKSVKKSKFLADVKVSLEVEREPDLIKNVQADAQECMDYIKGGLAANMQMATFVKGECNPCNKITARLWYPSLGSNYPDDSMATSKTLFSGKPHKIGDQNDSDRAW